MPIAGFAFEIGCAVCLPLAQQEGTEGMQFALAGTLAVGYKIGAVHARKES